MQPRQPSSSSQPDPLAGFTREQPVQPRVPQRPSSGPANTPPPPPRRVDPIRLVPAVRLYHRMRPGKTYPLTVQLQDEAGARIGPLGEDAIAGTGPLVTVQPVIPGAQVSPSRVDLPALPGAEAKFWVTPVNRRGGQLPDARIEFYSSNRLLASVRTPTRVVTRRLAWFFLFLAIAVPVLFAYMRGNPIVEFVHPQARQQAESRRQAGDAAPAAPAAPRRIQPSSDVEKTPASPLAKPADGNADVKREPTEGAKPNSPPAGATRPGDTKEGPRATTSGQPGTGQPGGPGRPGGGGGGRPPRPGGGAASGAMAIQTDPETEAAVLKPLEPRDSLDQYLTIRVHPFVLRTTSIAEGESEPVTTVKVVKWPNDLRGFFYLGLYYIKDGYALSEKKQIPGLLDAYEFIMTNHWLPFQDFIIGGILLVIAILLWLLQSASSRRFKAGVLEIAPA